MISKRIWDEGIHGNQVATVRGDPTDTISDLWKRNVLYKGTYSIQILCRILKICLATTRFPLPQLISPSARVPSTWDDLYTKDDIK
jgi:hypothetical protein